MQLPPLDYTGNGFLITTSQIPSDLESPNKDFGLWLQIQPSRHSFCFMLSEDKEESIQPVLHLFYSNEYLKEHGHAFPLISEFLEAGITDVLKKYRNCTLSMATAIVTTLNCNLSYGREPFYEGKALEILALALDRVTAPNPTASLLKLSPDDIEMLESARTILVSDFENIPTIKQLARKVGTNDFKLKKGFKQHFGTSVFAYVQAVRLDDAKQQLIETDLPVHDIAYMSGYAQPQNFAAAFKRKFGITPGEVRRER